jgi:glycosyltransferase involved in cell wall biosynthesis
MNAKKERIRILYIQKTGRGGSVISLYELLRELDTEIYEPFVLFQEKNYHYHQFQKLGIKIYYTDKKRNPEFSLKQTNRDIAKTLNQYSKFLSIAYRESKQIYLTLKNELPYIKKVYSIIKNKKIDIIHHNSIFWKNRLSVLLSKFMNIPQIGHMRMFHSFSLIDQYLAHHIDFFIYISKAIEDWYLKQGIHQKKGKVIYNPFKIVNFKSQVSHLNIRNEFGISKKDFLLCNVGRIDWWKGHKYFINAVEHVLKFNRNVKALIVGSPDPTKICQDYYQELRKQV